MPRAPRPSPQTEAQKAARTYRRRAFLERDRQAFVLRVAGATWREIAEALNMTNASMAFKAYERHMAALTPADEAEDYRKLELQRLDTLHKALWPKALGDPGDPRTGRLPVEPDHDAIRALLQIHDRRVRLLGLTREPEVDVEEELRALAKDAGLDPDEMVREAEAFLATSNRGRRRPGPAPR